MHIGVCLFMFHCVCLYCVDVSCRVWGGGVMKKDGGGGEEMENGDEGVEDFGMGK